MTLDVLLNILVIVLNGRLQKLANSTMNFMSFTPDQRRVYLSNRLRDEAKLKSVKFAEGLIDEAYNRSAIARRLIDTGKV